MADNLSQYLPAVKVGGRRLSTSNRQKPHMNTYVYNLERDNTNNSKEFASETVQQETRTSSDETAPQVADYPRPNPSDQNNEAPLHRQQRDEEPPKKDRQDKKVLESVQRKVESTIPTRDVNVGGKGHASGIRITQPAGKAFGI